MSDADDRMKLVDDLAHEFEEQEKMRRGAEMCRRSIVAFEYGRLLGYSEMLIWREVLAARLAADKEIQ